MRVYAIGDIHGQLEMLQDAHDRITADKAASGDPGAMVVHLGDLNDRGPDTAGVLQFLVDGLAAGEPWRAVLGNHDLMMRDFLEAEGRDDPHLEKAEWWLQSALGGAQTLASYGVHDTSDVEAARVAFREAVPDPHRAILAKLEHYIETDDLILVHAGIRPGVPLAEQVQDDLTWIREPFLSDLTDHGRLVVHGHTPVEEPIHAGNRVDLDTGAGFFRPLTAAVFEGRRCFILEEDGRRELLPPA